MMASRLFVTLCVGIVLLGLCCGPVEGGKISQRAARSDAAAAEAQTTAVVDNPAGGDTAADTEDDDDSALSGFGFWETVRSVWKWVRDDLRESLLDDDDTTTPTTSETTDGSPSDVAAATTAAAEGRTFGKIRRLQMALIPIVFKFGVLSAMVGFLVLLGMKTLFLVKVLVVMNALAILGKFLTLKTNFGHVEHAAPVTQWSGYSNWAPAHQSSGWTAPASPVHPPSKEIHLHIHGGQVQAGQSYGTSSYGGASTLQQQPGWERRSDPYAIYEPHPTAADDAHTDDDTLGVVDGSQQPQVPNNHRMY